MKLAVVIPIYSRADGNSIGYLDRALHHISVQTYTDYHVYLIGDAYEKPEEITELLTKYLFVTFENLPQSVERDRYSLDPEKYHLWCCGGVTPYNHGIDLALRDGYEYICHHDYDDWWEPQHLEYVNSVIDPYQPAFICTLSTYYGTHLPTIDIMHTPFGYSPRKGGCITSATCVKYSEIPVRFRDVFKETGTAFPADADFWERLNHYMMENNKLGVIITSVTCHHDEEGYLMKSE